MSGPLSGVSVVELAGIGPGPFATMVLADLGADVVRIDRADAVRSDKRGPSRDLLARGRLSVAVDLKQQTGLEVVLRLVESSDVFIEGFRPGTAERLGLGPEDCLQRNPHLVYGRVTGWGQDGPYAQMAGHDINFIALAGALEPIGRVGGPPVPPLNLIGDFGGGGMLLALGIAAALVERASSGSGQVIDASMVDGAALLTTFFHGMSLGPRGTNLLDSGAPFYDVYQCSDGAYIAIGSIEPQFFTELCTILDLEGPEWEHQMDTKSWPAQRSRLEGVFRSRSRAEWCEVFEGTDVCFSPVLSLTEAPSHPHARHRNTFVDHHGRTQPAPAPRFSRTTASLDRPPPRPGQDTDEVLLDRGFSAAELIRLRAAGAVR